MDNDLDVKIPFDKLPAFHIHSSIDFLGISQKFKLDATSKTITFSATDKLGPDFIAEFDLALRGLDLNSAKVDPKTADFFIKGTFEAKFADFIKDSAKKELNAAFADLGKVFKEGEKAVEGAKKKVEGLRKNINAERAKVRKEKAKAEAKVQGAIDKVNHLKGDLSHAWSKYHGCHGWGKVACKIKYGIEIGGLKGAITVADDVLEEVKKAIKHFPVDLDPRVWVLIAAKDVAIAALDVAEEAIKGVDEMDKFLKEGLDKIADALGKSININEASFQGDLRGIIEHDAPVDLTLKADFFGAKINEVFAFKFKDIAFDVEQLGLLGLYALEHLIDKAMGDISAALRQHARSVVGRRIDAKVASRNRELAANQSKFSSYRKLAAAPKVGKGPTSKFANYNPMAKSMVEEQATATEAYIKKLVLQKSNNPLDHEGPSLAYTKEYFEVGHTGLCLTNIGGEIRQHPCGKGKKSLQTWTTKPVTGDDAKLGYVHFTQGKQCASPEGKWVQVSKTFDNYTYQGKNFQGDGKLVMGGCYDDKIYQWKVLAHGVNWVRMVNRVTSHCLHFANSNAVPGQAKAVWGPCTGTANQVYRTVDKTTPTYHKAGLALRNDFNSLCLGDGTPDVPMVDCAKKPAKYDYLVDIRGFVKLVNTGTGKCLQPKDYKLGTSLTEKTCTQLDYQWWELIHVPGGWSIKNAQTHNCDKAGQKAGDAATQGVCGSWSQAILAPLSDPKSGVLFKKVKSSAFPSGKFADINVSPAERKGQYDYVRQNVLARKSQALGRKEAAVGGEIYGYFPGVRHKYCYRPRNPAYENWKDNYASIRLYRAYPVVTHTHYI